jgi:4-amino-4-deoxy-L-arabinose transferase-like glycosyltransferase
MAATAEKPSTTQAVLSDRELEQLAGDPPRPLFPLLRSAAEAMFPLAVALAFLPALYAIGVRPVTDAGALEGLEALRFLSHSRGGDASFAHGLEQLDALDFEPPLMRWLTGLSLKFFGIGTEVGLVAAPFLCTAGLLLACYSFGRRLGGEYLALMSVMFLAFHPLILEGAQQPVPQSAAILFALLTVVGMIAHWQKSPTVISYHGLLGGISLGLCLLAGGAIALAVVAILILHVALWQIEARWRRATATIWDRSQCTGRMAVWSIAVLVVTAFALAGWHVMLLRTRTSGDFWTQWLMPPATGSTQKVGRLASFFSVHSDLAPLVFPFMGLSLVGLGTILRDLRDGCDDSHLRHRVILFPWIFVAFLGCCVAYGPARASESTLLLWESLLVVPFAVAAAVGLIEIAERRVRVEVALVAGLLALVHLALLSQPLFGEPLFGLAATPDPVSVPMQSILGNPLKVVAVVVLGIVLMRFVKIDETHCRSVLSAMLIGVVLLNFFRGTQVPHESGRSHRELEQLREGIARQTDVSRMTFFGLARPESGVMKEPPARLIYSLVSLWPDASFKFARSSEDAVAGPAPPEAEQSMRQSLIVAWSPRGVTRSSLPHSTLKLVAPPFIFDDLEIAVYAREVTFVKIGD